MDVVGSQGATKTLFRRKEALLNQRNYRIIIRHTSEDMLVPGYTVCAASLCEQPI